MRRERYWSIKQSFFTIDICFVFRNYSKRTDEVMNMKMFLYEQKNGY